MKIKITFLAIIASTVFFSTSCKKKTIEPTPTTTKTSKNNTFVKTTIDGNLIFNEGTDLTGNSALWNTFSSPFQDSVYASFYSEIKNKTSKITVSFIGNEFSKVEFDSGDALIKTFVVGDHILSSNSSPGKVVIDYSETVNGVTTEWSSYYGNQTNSNFIITEKTLDKNTNVTEMYVKGTFNCKVYSSSNPSLSKTLSDGSFNLVYGKI